MLLLARARARVAAIRAEYRHLVDLLERAIPLAQRLVELEEQRQRLEALRTGEIPNTMWHWIDIAESGVDWYATELRQGHEARMAARKPVSDAPTPPKG